MEGLLGLIAFLLLAAFLAAPVVAVIAFVRARKLVDAQRQSEQRLDTIAFQLGAVLKRLNALERSASPPSRPVVTPPDAGAEIPDIPDIEPPAKAPPEAPAVKPPEPSAPPPRPHVPPTPPPPPPVAEAGEPPPPRVKIDWEQWIGIRGAAVLGAVALGLASLLFFKYTIDRGLITPTTRVVLGTLAGLGCLVGSEWLRRRQYRHTADAVAGAGVVILYAAFWAAHVLYGLIGMLPAFGLMVLVTAACCLLAVRHGSRVIAVLGLVGGFATPLLLSSGSDRPIGLFGYVLLLDLGLLAVGHKRRWPSLGMLSLLGTVLLQALWIGARMGPDRVLLGLAILAVFAVLFVFAGRLAPDAASRRSWVWTQLGAVFLPFAFALYFAGRVELGPHLYPVAILLALLCGAAGWIGRAQPIDGVRTASAAASVAVVAVWLLRHALTLALAWETVAVAAGLATLFHLFLERDRGASDRDTTLASLLSAGGFFLLLVYGASSAEVAAWPWLAGFAVLGVMLYRHAWLEDRGPLQLGAAVGLGLGLSVLHLSLRSQLPAPPLFLALLVAAPLALHAAAVQAKRTLRKTADQAAATLSILLLAGLAASDYPVDLSALPALGTALLLGVLGVLAATRLGNGGWYAAAVGATWIAHYVWIWRLEDPAPPEARLALAVGLFAVLLFSAWPFAAGARFAAGRLAWYAAALAGPFWFAPLKRVFVAAFGDGFIGVLPIALGAVALIAANRARTAFAGDEPLRRSALVWFSAVALCFVAVAIPLQLEKEWITIGWALEGLAVLALWRRLDHPGLKYFGLLLLGAVTVRLVANPALLGYYARSATRIFNWLMYTYLVPSGALLAGAALLAPLEITRAREWERPWYAPGHALGAGASGLAAIVVVFVWINLAIADWFATGTSLTLSFGDRPAQRLTVSIAWALYALLLLGVGMGRDSLGLRWLSLGFLLVTIGKVFLYDLGALEDLYRVASLVGLAVSLILVSLLYQRFVFRKRGAEEP